VRRGAANRGREGESAVCRDLRLEGERNLRNMIRVIDLRKWRSSRFSSVSFATPNAQILAHTLNMNRNHAQEEANLAT